MRFGSGLIVFLGLLLAARAAAPFEGSPFGSAVAAAAALEKNRDASLGNQALMLSGGYDALLLRVHLIRQARTSIDVQTFIWTNDEVGRLMMYELIEAAQRGVKVRIIADQLVSEKDPATVAFLATASPNLEIKHYRPPMSRLQPSRLQLLFAGAFSFRDINQRMHNKVMIFDDRILITGGRNIENTYYDHSLSLNFRDRDVLVIGPAVRAAVESFADYWKFRHAVASRELVDVAAAIARNDFPRYARRSDWDFGGYFAGLTAEADDAALISSRFVSRLQPVERAVFLSDVPGKSTGAFSKTARITRQLRGALEQAKERVTVQTPYLVLSRPAQELVTEMKKANPGLVIRVSTNSFASTDNLAAYSANYRLRGTYIERLGLEVHEFKPKPANLAEIFPQYNFMAARARVRLPVGSPPPFLSLHAKSLVVDDHLAFVGSYNLDPRSENLNTEVGLLVEDRAFARALREEIDRDMRAENSWVIARRQLPLGLERLNGVVDGVLSMSPVDLWPIQNTSSYELKSGATEVQPSDPAFYQSYREAGSFPGTEQALSTKEILTRLYKAIGTPITPVL
jgi:phosphatidylserine/phosphatidylglycerophosphate/cardiolipin synthase-like enzyme